MRVAINRCAQCGDKYTWQMSGSLPAADSYNDGTWCPNCKKVVSEALKAVPVRFARRMRDISEMPEFSDVSLDLLLKWERDKREWAEERRKAQNQCPQCSIESVFAGMTRIYPGLMHVDGSDSQNIRDIEARDGKHRGVVFMVSTWRNNPEYSIKAPMEWDLQVEAWTGRRW